MSNLVSNKSLTESSTEFTPAHREYLDTRYVRLEDARAAGVEALTQSAWAVLKRKDRYPGLPCYPMGGLLVRYQQTLDKLEHVRVRPDERKYYPGDKDNGLDKTLDSKEVPKWVSDSQGVVPYLPPWTLAVRGKTEVPLVIVEAPIKALALWHVGYHAIGLGGVLAGAHKPGGNDETGELEAHPELLRADHEGRLDYLAYDAGRANNPAVALGEARTAKILRDLGAIVRLIELPLLRPRDLSDDEAADAYDLQDQGPDDFLYRAWKKAGDQGAKDAWEERVKAAVPSDPVEWLEEALAEADQPTATVRRMLRNLPWIAAVKVGGKEAQGLCCKVGRKAGLTKDALAEALKLFGRKLASKLEKENPPFERGDEVELSEQLLSDLTAGKPERLVYDAGAVHVYGESGLWDRVEESVVVNKVAAFAGRPVRLGEERTVPLKIQHKTCLGASKLLRASGATRGEAVQFFDRAPLGVAFANGFLEIDFSSRSSKWHEGIPLLHQRVRHRIETTYDPAAPPAPPAKILGFLEAVFAGPECAEKVRCFREVAGCGILGVGTRFAKALILLGEGNDGKSVLMDLLRRCVRAGDTAAIDPHKLEHEYYLSSLAGKLINICGDVSKEALLATGKLKSAISGDVVKGRDPCERPYDFRPRATHFYPMNLLFPTNDYSHGFRRRWIILRCPNTVSEGNTDVAFLETLEAEIPAFVSWLVQGGLEAIKRGAYTIPEESRALVTDWTRDCDPVATYCAGRVRVLTADQINDPSGWTKAKTLYDDYRQWCEDNGHKHPLTSTTFGLRIKSLLKIEARERKTGRYYPVSLVKDGFGDELDGDTIGELLDAAAREPTPANDTASTPAKKIIRIEFPEIRVGTPDEDQSPDDFGRVSGRAGQDYRCYQMAAGVLSTLPAQPPGRGQPLKFAQAVEVELGEDGVAVAVRLAGLRRRK